MEFVVRNGISFWSHLILQQVLQFAIAVIGRQSALRNTPLEMGQCSSVLCPVDRPYLTVDPYPPGPKVLWWRMTTIS